MTEVYDFAAIGAGPAGESAAELAAFFGHRSVVIEKNRPGGTVTTTGGAPTKTLREAALYLTGFRDCDIYGLQMTTVPDVVLPTIRKRTRGVSDLLQITRTAPRNLEIVLSTGAKFQPNTILFAAGRVANTEGLDLDTAGVKIHSLGPILVDEHFRTSADSVFAAGDVLGPTLALPSTHFGDCAMIDRTDPSVRDHTVPAYES